MSALLSADDLNDFITPSVACIKTDNDKPQNNSGQEFEVEIDSTGQAIEVSDKGETTKLQKAQISLADCLACAGCITSSEEVLMSQHSHKEFLKALNEFKGVKIFVVSVSTQARASLANAFNISIKQVDAILIQLFIIRLGFSKIVGTELGRKIALKQLSQAVLQKREASGGKLTLPRLSSICPGWVMYVEKTHPLLLPLLETTKSPQQITGTILKRMTAKEYKVRPENVYHLSIMPCFDRKLEAARPENDEQIDVDCVITPKEVVRMMDDEGITMESLMKSVQNANESNLQDAYNKYAPKGWLKPIESWLSNEGSASGGYALHYLRELGVEYVKNGGSSEQLELKTIPGRNSDIYEYELNNKLTGECLGRSGVVNGFRNIQNMVRKIKENRQGKTGQTNGRIALRRRRQHGKVHRINRSSAGVNVLKCDLIEVMACPSGCINGGGLIDGPSDHKSTKIWVQNVLDKYRTIPICDDLDDSELEQWITSWLDKYTVCRTRLLETKFKEIEKPKDEATIALTTTW